MTQNNQDRKKATLLDLTGRLGSNIEEKALKNGEEVMRFSLSANQAQLREDQEIIGETKWYQINAFGVFGEYCKKILKKGDVVSLRGFYKQRAYTKDSGEKGISHEVTLSGKDSRLKVVRRAASSEESPSQESGLEEPLEAEALPTS